MPLFAASSWESLLVFVVIMLLSGLSNWIKRRQGRAEDTWPEEPSTPPTKREPRDPSPAPVLEPPPKSPVPDWEEQLRRLLEEEPVSPPPVVRPVSVPAAPAKPAAAQSPRPATPPAIPRSAPAAGLPVPTSSPVRFPEGVEDLDTAAAPSFQLATLQQSANAYLHASQLDRQTAARLGRITAQTAHPVATRPPDHRPRRSSEVAQAVAQLRTPRAARQAILATVILGPPKAMEP